MAFEYSNLNDRMPGRLFRLVRRVLPGVALVENEIRPKFRTLAPRPPGSRSRCVTASPRRLAMTACMVPRIPPPTMTTRPDSAITKNKYSQVKICIAKLR